MAEAEVRSPCINVCSLNADDLCIGCWRTGGEIAGWFDLSNEEKRAVLVQCYERAKAAGWLFE